MLHQEMFEKFLRHKGLKLIMAKGLEERGEKTSSTKS